MSKNKISTDALADPGEFRHEASTNALRNELMNARDIDTYLKKNKKNMIPRSLPLHLEMLLEQKGLKKADVARGSLLDRKYVYQIFDGTKTPSRDKLIAMAFGLHLSAEETQTMLKLSGNRELYPRDERDSVILFSLQRKKKIGDANESLYDHGFNILGSTE